MPRVHLSHFLLILLCSPLSLIVGQSFIIENASISSQETTFDGINLDITLYVLVVLMELQDDPHHQTHTVQHFNDLFFSNESFSIRQYYLNASYGSVDLSGDVLGWYQAVESLTYYGGGTRMPPGQDVNPNLLAEEAYDHAVDAGKNPLNYDLFVVIHSGDGQEYSGNSDDIWSHQWYVSTDVGWVAYSMNHEYVDYSTPSHELGHALFFPDLYDHQEYERIFAGPYGMMGRGDSHFSIWNKYYSQISNPQSIQFLTSDYRLQITNYTADTFSTINPIAMEDPQGVMWLEIGWNSSEYTDPKYGSGWTISIRENMDYDASLPKFGMVIAEITVGPRSLSQTQVTYPEDYPPWNVVDAHPETEENKDDAPFSLAAGDIGTFVSGTGWAAQILETFPNKSYRIRVTNESNIPVVILQEHNEVIKGSYDIYFTVDHLNSSGIDTTEVSIDNGPWQVATPDLLSDNGYIYSWDSTTEREGSHLIRARAIDNVSSPYIGYSSFIVVEVDNRNGSILVVDDDLGRSAEVTVLEALDSLGFTEDYEIMRTSSFTEAEVTAEELSHYDAVLWIGNPEISPISNSHINYNEFKEIEEYFNTDLGEDRSPGIIFMSSYTIFDFSNQGPEIQNDYRNIFQAESILNFRSPATMLQGSLFLKNLPQFTLGNTDTLRATRGSDGELVNLLPGATPILADINPQFPSYNTKGYIVDNGQYRLINYQFQPDMVPEDVLPQLISLSLNYINEPANGTAITTTTESTPSVIDPVPIIGVFGIGGLVASVLFIKFRLKPRKGDSI
ncbi:MAG: immune inhibitor A domain-containing protein [Candidatus Hodarchaeales archaeon]|jgi:M6 family metalloprotease-like protein